MSSFSAKSQTAIPEPQGLSPSAQEELEGLRADGYRIHKLWSNGIELRKGPPFSEGKLLLHVVLVVLFATMPFVMRSLVANASGYRHRVLLTHSGEIRMV
jgi:hypothetical protein